MSLLSNLTSKEESFTTVTANWLKKAELAIINILVIFNRQCDIHANAFSIDIQKCKLAQTVLNWKSQETVKTPQFIAFKQLVVCIHMNMKLPTVYKADIAHWESKVGCLRWLRTCFASHVPLPNPKSSPGSKFRVASVKLPTQTAKFSSITMAGFLFACPHSAFLLSVGVIS